MAFPTDLYYLRLYSRTAYPIEINAGNSMIDLAGDYGFRIVNPMDFSYTMRQAMPINAKNPLYMGEATQRNFADMMMTTQVWGDDPEEYIQKLRDLAASVDEAQEIYLAGGVTYARFGVYDGAAWTYRRRYCVPFSTNFPTAPKTQHQASTKGAAMVVRCHDPAWYTEPQVTKTIIVTAGAGDTGVFASGTDPDTSRVVVQIQKTTADNPTNVLVWEAQLGTTFSFIMSGSLTAANDYWSINSVTGQVTHVAAAGPTTTDAMNSFIGVYPYIASGDKRIFVTDTAASDFVVNVYYLPRYI